MGSSGRGRGRSQPARTPGGGRLECRRSLPARVGGERGWPTLYGKSARRPVTPYWGHPPGTGPGPGSACGLDGCPRVAGEYMWERGRSRAPNRGNFGGSLHTRSFPARQAASLWLVALWAPALAGPPPQERGRSPTAAVPTLPRLKCAGAWCGPAGVTEARGPFGPRHRWSLWIVGRWPVLIPRFPGGAAPREPPFVGVSAGSGPPTRGPYAAGHTAPARADWWNTLRADRCLRGYSGGNWMATFSRPPGAPGVVAVAGRSFAPSRLSPSYILVPSGALGRRGLVACRC